MRILAVAIICVVAGAGLAQQQQQPDPCDRKSRVVGDITYCDRYWECVAGTPQLYDCPNGLVFVGRNRGIAEGCDYPWRGAYCDTKQLANPPISTEHCDWLYGIFGHETSCTRYWTCWNGTATEQFCIGGLLYNEETHACDWPQNVAGCQKHPLCKDDPNANVPLGKSCERYWACQGGYPRLQRCPATLVFDKQSRRCVNPPTVDCDVPSTTPPPLEEGQTPVRQAPRPQRRRPTQQATPVRDSFVPENAIPIPQQGSRPLSSNNFQERPSGNNFQERPSGNNFQERPSGNNFQERPSGNNFQERPSGNNFQERPSGNNFQERPQSNFQDARPSPSVGNFRPPPIPGAIPLQ